MALGFWNWGEDIWTEINLTKYQFNALFKRNPKISQNTHPCFGSWRWIEWISLSRTNWIKIKETDAVRHSISHTNLKVHNACNESWSANTNKYLQGNRVAVWCESPKPHLYPKIMVTVWCPSEKNHLLFTFTAKENLCSRNSQYAWQFKKEAS